MAENYKRVFASTGVSDVINDVDYNGGLEPIVGAVPPSKGQHNSIWNEVDNKIAEIHREGVVTYDAATDYTVATNDITKGSDGVLYRCVSDNGPGSTPVDPVGNPSVWSAGVDTLSINLTANSGHRITADGFIEQWGESAFSVAGTAVVFDIPFPNECMRIFCTDDTLAVATNNTIGANTKTTTGFNAVGDSAGIAAYYAIGF